MVSRLNFSSEGNPLDGAVFERSAFSNGRQQFGLRSESFFDNEPKQMLSAVPDKNKQTVAPPISGCFVVVAVPLIEGATVCLFLALKSGIADNICLGSLSKKD